ncbi:MAG: hypothetical protein Q4B16_00015 [Bacteroidia bacterium]|nr:hypothetical protein [Bacteroidia bacterium]
MKSFLAAATLTLLSLIPLGAQSSQKDFEKNLPDSVKYYLPSFGQGRVVYKDGQFSNGRFNISTIDQSLRFLDESGNVMALSDAGSVDRVSIDGMLFIKYQNSFMAFSMDIGDVYLCASRRIEFKDSKKGAFGLESSTTNIKEARKIEGYGGQIFDLDGNLNYTVKLYPFIYKNKVAYVPSRRLILRTFKDRTEKIEAYLAEHDVNFSDFDQVYTLLAAIKD